MEGPLPPLDRRISSRAIASADREHLQFIAPSADSPLDFSIIPCFVSRRGESILTGFTQNLVICNREELIGHQIFAIHGMKLPSNVAKFRLGLREDSEREA